MRRSLLSLGLSALLYSSQAQSADLLTFPNGQSLLDTCSRSLVTAKQGSKAEAADIVEMVHCFSYVQGFVVGWYVGTGMGAWSLKSQLNLDIELKDLDQSPAGFCPPKRDVPPAELMKIILTDLEQNPENREKPVVTVIPIALAQAYPCVSPNEKGNK